MDGKCSLYYHCNFGSSNGQVCDPEPSCSCFIKLVSIMSVLDITYMVSGIRDNRSSQDKFTERLYDKKLALLAESELTLLSFSEMLL